MNLWQEQQEQHNRWPSVLEFQCRSITGMSSDPCSHNQE